MESHLIYSASSHMILRVNWLEWVYCGVGDDIKEDVINKLVNEYLRHSILYLVSTRKESSAINKKDTFGRIKKDLEQQELFLWDANFKKVIGFNKIGVMRNGLV